MTLVLAVVLLFSVIRLLRWLSFWQQKEYRLDRFLSFFATSTGKAQLKNIITFPISPSQLIRPRFTSKAFLLFFLSITLSLGLMLTFANVFIWLTIYLFIPFLIVLVTLPFQFLQSLFILVLSQMASYRLRHSKPIIIGITGSYGKTTTKFLLAQLLNTTFKVWHPPSSFNTRLSVSKAILTSYQSQPYVILEYAAYTKNEIADLAKLFSPSLAILTGITHQHQATFGTVKDIIAAKRELPLALPSNSPVFYNHLNAYLNKLVQPLKHLKLISLDESLLSTIKLNPEGFLQIKLAHQTITTPILGQHYATNLVLAVQVARHLGVKEADLAKTLAHLKLNQRFIRRLKTAKGALILDDITSNPAGFSAVINLAQHLKNKPKFLISSGIVDLGSATDKVHEHLAKHSAKVFDSFLHTGSEGATKFSQAFGSRYHSIQSLPEFKQALKPFVNQPHLIVVEGKIPQVYQQYLNTLTYGL